MHKICFTVSLFHASTCLEHHVLIVRRAKLYYTASGIVTPVGGRLVRRLREDSLSIILVINQLDAQNMFYNKFISCLYMIRAPCAHRQEVKIVLYSIRYRHACRWPSRAQSSLNLCTGWPPIGVMIPDAV